MKFQSLGAGSNCGLKRSCPLPDDSPSSPLQRSLRFDELLGKFGKEPHALSEHDLNQLVCECMFHGDVEALRDILAAQRLQTLDIPRQADERALWTLLSALPESCSIDRLILRENHLDHVKGALLLEVMGRTQLESLAFHSCNWNVMPGELTCPGLPELQDLHVEGVGNPMPLLDAILKASQVSKFVFASNPGMNDEHHDSLARLLDTQCEAKLRDLTFRDLQAPYQTLERLLEHYAAILAKKTTTLTRLDLSENKLTPEACRCLAAALKNNSTLLDMALAGCWPEGHFVSDWSSIAMLIPTRLVKLDLSHNCFPLSAPPILTKLQWCKNLQHLDLHAVVMDGAANPARLAYSLDKLKLKSLCLPKLSDVLYELFLNSMKNSLLFFRVDGMEELCTQMPQECRRLYPNYLALKACVDSNWQKWNGAVPLVEEGMKVLLSRLGGVDPMVVPLDIARRAARFAVDRNGAETESLSVLNKSARPAKVPASETSFLVDKS